MIVRQSVLRFWKESKALLTPNFYKFDNWFVGPLVLKAALNLKRFELNDSISRRQTFDVSVVTAG